LYCSVIAFAAATLLVIIHQFFVCALLIVTWLLHYLDFSLEICLRQKLKILL
jgi:hypothetical protein